MQKDIKGQAPFSGLHELRHQQQMRRKNPDGKYSG